MTDHSKRTSPRAGDYVRSLGPGLVAGASDVDPTTVATMSVVGSTTGFALSWLTLLTLPMLAVIQAISSRVAVAGGADLQTLVRRRYPRGAQLLLLGSVLVVTAMTTAADLEAGAAALGLLLHIGRQWLVVPVAAAVLTVLLLGSYDEVQRVLKYLMLGLLAYVVAAVIAHPHWGQVAHGSLVPRISLRHDYVEGALAILGTTLTSYVYVWQTVELSEERPALSWLRPEEADAIAGIVVAVVIFWAILVATGATLAEHHAHVQTAEDAARALEPLVGNGAKYLFGAGLLGSSLLALPVLMGTIAYIVGAEFDWRRGLSQKVTNAKKFYAVVGLSTLTGVGVAFAGVSPIRLLFVTSIAGGIATPISLVYLMLVASDRALMHGSQLAGPLRVVGWAVTALISGFALVYLVEQLVRR